MPRGEIERRVDERERERVKCRARDNLPRESYMCASTGPESARPPHVNTAPATPSTPACCCC